MAQPLPPTSSSPLPIPVTTKDVVAGQMVRDIEKRASKIILWSIKEGLDGSLMLLVVKPLTQSRLPTAWHCKLLVKYSALK